MGYHSQGKLEDFGRVEPLEQAARRTVQRSGDELHRLTVEHTPVAKPPLGHEVEWLASRRRAPGTLKESWQESSIEVEGTVYRIWVLTHDPIAPYVEYPTLPHIIVPRKPGGRLRFWDALGNTIYAMIVHHTGTKGSYMLTTGLGEVAVIWRDIGREEMERWAREQAALV